MKIEVLFPEFANLFGDCWNWRYLARCMPEAEMIETGYGEQPRFVSEKVDMIIMGAMTEHGQELAVKKLMPHRDRLRQLIDSGVVFLMTANAGEASFRCMQSATCCTDLIPRSCAFSGIWSSSASRRSFRSFTAIIRIFILPRQNTASA